MAETTSGPGLVVEYTRTREGWQLTQRGNAFFRCLLGAWISLIGIGFLADLPARFGFGMALLTIPVIYFYVLRNYPAELSKSSLRKLQDDDGVISIDGYPDNRDEMETASTDDELVKNLARTKMRLKAYKLDSLKSTDELVQEVYDELADLGYFVTPEQVEDWTKNLVEPDNDCNSEGCRSQ